MSITSTRTDLINLHRTTILAGDLNVWEKVALTVVRDTDSTGLAKLGTARVTKVAITAKLYGTNLDAKGEATDIVEGDTVAYVYETNNAREIVKGFTDEGFSYHMW